MVPTLQSASQRTSFSWDIEFQFSRIATESLQQAQTPTILTPFENTAVAALRQSYSK